MPLCINPLVDLSAAVSDASWTSPPRRSGEHGPPLERADAFLQLFEERRTLGESKVYLGMHEALGIQPTTFAEFARRHAAVFRGEAAFAVTAI